MKIINISGYQYVLDIGGVINEGDFINRIGGTELIEANDEWCDDVSSDWARVIGSDDPIITVKYRLSKLNKCQHCDVPTIEERYNGYILCEDCLDKYDDKTGFCSLSCCVDGHCDDSC